MSSTACIFVQDASFLRVDCGSRTLGPKEHNRYSRLQVAFRHSSRAARQRLNRSPRRSPSPRCVIGRLWLELGCVADTSSEALSSSPSASSSLPPLFPSSKDLSDWPSVLSAASSALAIALAVVSGSASIPSSTLWGLALDERMLLNVSGLESEMLAVDILCRIQLSQQGV